MKICDYGCGQEGKYYFKTPGKWCCSESYKQCPAKRKEQSIRSKEKWKDLDSEFNSDSYREKRSEVLKKAWKDLDSGFNSDLYREKQSEANKGKNNPMYGKTHSEKAIRKNRISTIKSIEDRCGQCSPNYNPFACKIIDKYGKKHNYNFQHAENGGEYYIKGLGYWVDGYDKDGNVVIEVDESFHFDRNGDLKERDAQRQKEIEEFLNCKFIRLKI